MRRFQIVEPGDFHCIKEYVGETIDLVCESICGDLYWFVNDKRVVPYSNVENATASASSACVNENNTCAHQSYIDCQEANEDGRFLRSMLTITPTVEQQFLIECEADLCGEEFRKSVMLTAKRTFNYNGG